MDDFINLVRLISPKKLHHAQLLGQEVGWKKFSNFFTELEKSGHLLTDFVFRNFVSIDLPEVSISINDVTLIAGNQ